MIQIVFDREYIKHFVWGHTWLIDDYDSELEPLILEIMQGAVQPKKMLLNEFAFRGEKAVVYVVLLQPGSHLQQVLLSAAHTGHMGHRVYA